MQPLFLFQVSCLTVSSLTLAPRLNFTTATRTPLNATNTLQFIRSLVNFDRLMERSAKEITMFAVAAFGVWCGVWAILLTNGWIGAFALVLLAISLGSFACGAKAQ
jgi:hypothetical protein